MSPLKPEASASQAIAAVLVASGAKAEDFREALAPTSLSRPPHLCPLLPLETFLCHRGTSP